MNEQIETFIRTLNLMYPNFTVCVLINERGTGEVKLASNLPTSEITKSFIKDVGTQLTIGNINPLKLN